MTDLILLLPLALLVVAATYDLRTREIPDWIAIALIVVALFTAVMGWAGVQWWMVPTGGALGLAIGYALFRWARLGGGDAKLIAALGAILGPLGLMFMLFWMALGGGVLALIAWMRGHRDYAYAPAITAAFAAYLVYPGGYLQWLSA